MSQIKAVLFDAGMTLVRTRVSVGKTYAETAGRYGVNVDPEAVQRAFRSLWDERRDRLHLASSETLEREWWRELVAEVFRQAGKFEAFGDSFETFFQDLYELFSMPEMWRVFDDVVPALEMIETRNVRRAVVSNWDSRLPVLLARLELSRHFEFILTSAQAGFRKPDRRIFDAALGRLGLPPDQVLFVGDLYEDDYAGAANAGLTPVLIDRADGDHVPPNSIKNLMELARWL